MSFLFSIIQTYVVVSFQIICLVVKVTSFFLFISSIHMTADKGGKLWLQTVFTCMLMFFIPMHLTKGPVFPNSFKYIKVLQRFLSQRIHLFAIQSIRCMPNSWHWYLFTQNSQGVWRTASHKERKVRLLTELLHAPSRVQEGQVLSCVALLFMNLHFLLLLHFHFYKQVLFLCKWICTICSVNS